MVCSGENKLVEMRNCRDEKFLEKMKAVCSSCYKIQRMSVGQRKIMEGVLVTRNDQGWQYSQVVNGKQALLLNGDYKLSCIIET